MNALNQMWNLNTSNVTVNQQFFVSIYLCIMNLNTSNVTVNLLGGVTLDSYAKFKYI